MNRDQRAAMLIRSLMRELRISDHVVFPQGHKAISAGSLLEELDAPKLGDGTPDAALAIGEHAFRAGYHAAAHDYTSGGHGGGPGIDAAWSDYEPSEDVKALS